MSAGADNKTGGIVTGETLSSSVMTGQVLGGAGLGPCDTDPDPCIKFDVNSTDEYSAVFTVDQPMELLAFDLEDGDCVELEQVWGPNAGTHFEPVALGRKKFALSACNNRLAIPFMGRFRLRYKGIVGNATVVCNPTDCCYLSLHPKGNSMSCETELTNTRIAEMLAFRKCDGGQIRPGEALAICSDLEALDDRLVASQNTLNAALLAALLAATSPAALATALSFNDCSGATIVPDTSLATCANLNTAITTLSAGLSEAIVDALVPVTEELNDRLKVSVNEFPPASGVSASEGVVFWTNKDKAAFLYSIIDAPGGQNDETGFFRNIASVPGWQQNPANIGIGSFSTGRGNLPYAYLARVHGHSNSGYGVASTVGGAGSCTGNPDLPNDPFLGYCADAYGKNVHAQGTHSFARGNGSRAFGTASIAMGRLTFAGQSIVAHGTVIGGTTIDDDGLGAFAAGDETIAYGNGGLALGQYIISYGGGQTIGRGVNPSSPLVNTEPGSIGLGSNVTRPTLVLPKGPGTTQGVTDVQIRSADPATPGGLEIMAWDGSVKASIKSTLINSGSGGYWSMQLDVMNAGVLARGFDIAFDGTTSLLPGVAGTHRIGSSTKEIGFIFLINAPIVSSDERKKQDIEDIDAAVLRAWSTVRPKQYRLKSAPEKMQYGYIAQEIIAAFSAEGLNALDTGLVNEGEDGSYGVNYDMCAVLSTATR